MSRSSEYLPIKDYAIIGDCHTAALVSKDGSIDWYCPGRFDNPAVFCRILDSAKGGFLEIRSTADRSSSRKYLERTNILISEFETDNSRLAIKQFMPIQSANAGGKNKDVKTSYRIVSLLEGLAGKTEIRIRFKPTFNFAMGETRFEKIKDGIIAGGSTGFLCLYAQGIEFSPNQNGTAEASLKLNENEKLWLVLDYADNSKDLRTSFDDGECQDWFDDTLHYWQDWVDRCDYNGRYREQVVRSALTLKLLTYEPTGAIIAAPTTSIPEEIGGNRNWDYRFAWLRDSALILYALMTIGYQNEARDFFRWLRSTQERDPTSIPQIMYKIDGQCDIHENILNHLEGYRKSQPVRVGNAAASQFQLDIFGEILRSAHLYFSHDVEDSSDRRLDIKKIWNILKNLVNDAAKNWMQPDSGLWEFRGEQREFLYSRLMCWAALDRGVRLAKKFQLGAPLEKWEHTRDEIRSAILKKGYNEKVRAFTQAFGSQALDAGALAIPRIGFLPPTDPRVVSTVNAIQDKLARNGFVYRYLTEDGLPGTESTFSLCTFWLIDVLALSGRKEEAHELFERIIHCTNDVGLMSEELDPGSGEFLGNFPQGFTHLALIGSAVNLAKAERHGSEDREENEAERMPRARDAAKEG